MVALGLLQESLSVHGGVLESFLSSSPIQSTHLPNGGWFNNISGDSTLTGHYNALYAAMSDIVMYLTILTDWVMQATVNAFLTASINAATT